jgi:hypothetical protein
LERFGVVESSRVCSVGVMNTKFIDKTAAGHNGDVSHLVGRRDLQHEIRSDVNASAVENSVGELVRANLYVDGTGQQDDVTLRTCNKVGNGSLERRQLRKRGVNELSKIGRGADVKNISG